MNLRELVLALALALAMPWSATATALPEHSPFPGGVAVIEVEAGTTPSFDGRPVLTVEAHDGRHLALVGIPLSALPGVHRLSVGAGELAFEVRDKVYETQRLTIPNQRMVTPDPEDLERIASERPRIIAAARAWTADPPVSLRLVTPAQGRRSSAFGLRRIMNDLPRNPHAGIDIAAPTGTPIAAAGQGVVVDMGDFYFNGKTVWVDHGRGMITMYCHMDRIDVQPGQIVAPGDLLGTIGATGRVTGAHLHFSVILNGVFVDPDLFLQ